MSLHDYTLHTSSIWNYKGGRVVLLGNPMPAPTACLAAPYLEGLAALAEAGLVWEWCCMTESIPAITEACKCARVVISMSSDQYLVVISIEAILSIAKVCTCARVHVCTCACVHVCVHACICVCVRRGCGRTDFELFA